MGKLFHDERLIQVERSLSNTIKDAVTHCPFDVLVVCGYRSNLDQLKAYMTGKSKAKPGQSKHNKMPSQAVDLIAIENGTPLWERIDLLTILNTEITKAAAKYNVKITWSKTWKKFVEFDHWEIA